MLKFISSLCAVALSLSAYSQTAKDTIVAPVKAERYGLRVGIDLHRLSKGFYTDDYRGLELVADYRLTKKIYVAGELGNEDYTLDEDQLNFTTKGSYFKVGFDYNTYENWLDMENMIYVGARYGFASFSQNLNSYTIYDNRVINENGIRYLDAVTVNADREYSGLTAHWVEIVGGIKAELFDNLYLGFSVRLNSLISDKKPDNFDNLYIPGFNRTYEGSFGVGFNYSVSYFIPLYKKAEKVKPEQQ
ncbi:hypothetical protein E0W68_12245 [Flavobacterium salilacus subsp. salilacus]|uniref:DUF6048 family protein n=1 Tax=Flavobacterium TaxID=237 RepID=UPI001075735B|nr:MULTISPECIES: DUF6048 family protein [Flavobacterium]KAF2516297.1 hypothetical protein E0W68_12245 [Flavobacterium salilacus subsp. salilacus]MBE1613827.1 hypothetical protein [Flavobacterium sp. SaA2.13]